MKVSDSAISPLGIWLANLEATPEQVMRAGIGPSIAEPLSQVLPRPTHADHAEGLLELDIWATHAGPERALLAPPQPPLQDSTALDGAVEHIISPLC